MIYELIIIIFDYLELFESWKYANICKLQLIIRIVVILKYKIENLNISGLYWLKNETVDLYSY